LKALAAAHAAKEPVILRFSAGRYIVSEILAVERGDLVLQGAGSTAGGTELYFPRPLRIVGDGGRLDELRQYLVKYEKRQKEPENNIDILYSEYAWTGGFIWVGKAGARPSPYLEEFDKRPPAAARAIAGDRAGFVIRVADNTLKVGDRIEVRWYNERGANSPLIGEIYGDAATKVGSHHWTFVNRPLVTQPTTVVAVRGDEIEIASPLMHKISAEVPADLVAWSPLTGVGIEDLALLFPDTPSIGHHLEEGYNGVYLTGVADSWVRNLRIVNADSGILNYDSANVSLIDIRTEGVKKAHYSVQMGNAHNILAERVMVFNPVFHPLSFNTQSTRCVYKDAEVFSGGVLDQHAGANHQNLFDNVTMHVSAKRDKQGPFYVLYDGSGAPYWQPGHGAQSTAWNLRVIVESGAYGHEKVRLLAPDEGPGAIVAGLSGNREFSLDYRPQPFIFRINQRLEATPSLYDAQRQRRRHVAASALNGAK
jgi:hypothetical protein